LAAEEEYTTVHLLQQHTIAAAFPPAARGAAKMPLTVLDTTTTVKGTAILQP
jgi:hypothetical protein